MREAHEQGRDSASSASSSPSPGLDGHDRGAKVVARALADAGYEVVYTGLHQTPEMIAAAAVQEAVDAVGLSIMSGAHMTLFPAVIDALKARGAGDVLVFGGGIVPKEDLPKLQKTGVAKIFKPGATTQRDHRLGRDQHSTEARGRMRRLAIAIALWLPRCSAPASARRRRGDGQARAGSVARAPGRRVRLRRSR